MDESEENQLLHVGHLNLEGPLFKLVLGVGEPREDALVGLMRGVKDPVEDDIAEGVDGSIFVNDEGVFQIAQVRDLYVKEKLITMSGFLHELGWHLWRVIVDRALNGLELRLSRVWGDPW